MARIPKVKTPTEDEKASLANLLYGSSLFQAHPVIVQNVREGVAQLLHTLGRDDLLPIWDDQETLFTFLRDTAAPAPG